MAGLMNHSVPLHPSSTAQNSRFSSPVLPLPIFRVGSASYRYLVYDVATAAWLRSTHQILGVAIGGLPQFPQQNVFFGLPLELMPEEARLLVEDKKVAFIVDDTRTHASFVEKLASGDSKAINGVIADRKEASRVGQEALEEMKQARLVVQEQSKMKRQLAKKNKGKNKGEPKLDAGETMDEDKISLPFVAARLPAFGHADDEGLAVGESLFGSSSIQASNPVAKRQDQKEESWTATLTTTSALMDPLSLPRSDQPVEVSEGRYAVYKQLHDRGYFMSPGLRFGCQLTAYPGDPLRFHSHFLATGVDWEEEIDLLDIVGGGRLGTGVKKGYLIGGVQEEGERTGEVRTFCIEWGGM